MDELAAAASVLAMDVESNPDEDGEQDVLAGEPGGEDARSCPFKPAAEEKENHSDHPEQRDVRTDHLKVSKYCRTQLRALPALSFTFWWHPS
jgi:hypothetical protein|eukprot:7377912-Prymnesium_polylepis.1